MYFVLSNQLNVQFYPVQAGLKIYCKGVCMWSWWVPWYRPMKVCHLLQILAQNHLLKIGFIILKNSFENLFVTYPTEVSYNLTFKNSGVIQLIMWSDNAATTCKLSQSTYLHKCFGKSNSCIWSKKDLQILSSTKRVLIFYLYLQRSELKYCNLSSSMKWFLL